MTDKIRIVGTFGEGAAAKVESFAATLEGVESVSLLHDGVEQLPQPEPEQEAEPTA